MRAHLDCVITVYKLERALYIVGHQVQSSSSHNVGHPISPVDLFQPALLSLQKSETQKLSPGTPANPNIRKPASPEPEQPSQ